MSDRHMEFVQEENRKRSLKSLGFTLLLYLLLLGVLWGWSLLFRQDMDMNQGPVLIRLGEPDGADISTPAEIEPEPEEEPVKTEETLPEESVPEETAPEEPEPSDVPRPVDEPVTKTPVNSQTASDSPSVPSPVIEKAPVVPKAIKGSEAGNNYELTSEGGDIGRSLWVPIYLYMPLPRVIPSVIDGQGGLNSLLDNVIGDETRLYTAEQNRAILLKYYEKKQKTLVLNKPVPLESRSELWSILERAGYDMNRAEYKTGRTLLPVTIYFEVEPSLSSQANRLTGLEIKKSSGYSDIDEAVLYAFQQSSYYNGSGKTIKGRFTYSFFN